MHTNLDIMLQLIEYIGQMAAEETRIANQWQPAVLKMLGQCQALIRMEVKQRLSWCCQLKQQIIAHVRTDADIQDQAKGLYKSAAEGLLESAKLGIDVTGRTTYQNLIDQMYLREETMQQGAVGMVELNRQMMGLHQVEAKLMVIEKELAAAQAGDIYRLISCLGQLNQTRQMYPAIVLWLEQVRRLVNLDELIQQAMRQGQGAQGAQAINRILEQDQGHEGGRRSVKDVLFDKLIALAKALDQNLIAPLSQSQCEHTLYNVLNPQVDDNVSPPRAGGQGVMGYFLSAQTMFLR